MSMYYMCCNHGNHGNYEISLNMLKSWEACTLFLLNDFTN